MTQSSSRSTGSGYHTCLLHLAVLTIMLLVFAGCSDSSSTPGASKVGLASLLSTAEDLPGSLSLDWPVASNEPLNCLPDVEEMHGTYMELTTGRPFFAQYLMLYDSEEVASGVIKDAQQLWMHCTAVTWKVAPEPLDDPHLGDQSRALFVPVDCCTVVDPVVAGQNGHLYAVFVRRGRLIELITVITRDEGQFETIATAADAKLGDRSW